MGFMVLASLGLFGPSFLFFSSQSGDAFIQTQCQEHIRENKNKKKLLTESVPFHRYSWSQGTESACLGALRTFIKAAATTIYQTQ